MEKSIAEKKVNTNGIIAVAISTSLITTFLGTSLNISIPNIGHEFDCSALLLGWVITIYTLLTSALSVPFGRLADLKGKRTFLLLGIVIVGITAALCAFAWSIWALIILRAIQAVGASMIFCTNVAVAVSACPPSMRGQVLGLCSSAAYIGLTIGPVIGGLINEYFSWRILFLIPVAISVVVLIMALRILPKDSHKSEHDTADLQGNVLFVAMIVTLIFGLSTLTSNPYGKFFAILGVVLAILFWKREMACHAPVIKVRLFKDDRVYRYSIIIVLLNYAMTFGVGYILAIYLQEVGLLSSQMAGLFMACQPVVMAIMSPIAGRLSDKHSPFKLVTIGLVFCLISTAWLLFMDENFPLWMTAASLMVQGVGTAFFVAPNNNIIMDRVSRSDYAVTTSLISTFRTLGNSTAMVVISLMVYAVMGKGALADANPSQLTEIVHGFLIVITIFCILSLALSFVRRTKNSNK